MSAEVAYKILTAPQWSQFLADGVFAGAPVDLADGYIHMSAADQVAGTLDKHFAGQEGLVLAAIDLAALGGEVRWEESRGGALFPHLYGHLPMSAVLAHSAVVREVDGSVRLPDQPSRDFALPRASG